MAAKKQGAAELCKNPWPRSAMNIAAAYGVARGREAIIANLLVGIVSDIEAIAHERSL